MKSEGKKGNTPELLGTKRAGSTKKGAADIRRQVKSRRKKSVHPME